MGGQQVMGLGIADLAQDPYYPQEPAEAYGPSFLDTQACLCSLQTPVSSPSEDDDIDTGDNGDTGSDDTGDVQDSHEDEVEEDGDGNAAKRAPAQRFARRDEDAGWQCIGNQTQGIYTVTSGKWFKSLHGGSNTNLSIDDASNGPDLNAAFAWNPNTTSFDTADESKFSPYDWACTGINQTTFSTSFYRAVAEDQAGEDQVDAAPCWRPGALPVGIQNLTSWQSTGCKEGFLCANNTVNSLPQYCPPLTECQTGRLSGKVCQLNDTNIGMGPFEPVVCQEGWYCPTNSSGLERLPCPAGTYCQPGASTPTPCAKGSYCPEKSTYQLFLVPLAVLLILDVAAALALVWYAVSKRVRNQRTQSQGRATRIGTISRSLTGYKEIPEEADTEMLPMQATFMPGADTFYGFHEALERRSSGSGSDTEDPEAKFSPQLRAFVDSMRKATDATQFGLSFSYTDLSFHPKGASKPILQNVTGSIERGSLTAVMGGSGAGKSTFVNVLMGKTTNTGGAVMVNHIPGKIKRYKKLIGYVPQDDIVLPELTVYENILHSARIRLPRSWTDEDIKAHVNAVVDCLELSHVRDSMVGSVGKPIISGGQRKRVSIGMELSAAPMAIFLDEPTSGLDATSASSIMLTLKAIARLGISVIVIIHQPRTEIFDMLDNLILLGNGQIIYEGREDAVQPFFEEFGYHFPEHSNHGDVVTDIITGNGRSYKPWGKVSKESLIAHWAQSVEHANLKRKHESLKSNRASVLALAESKTLLKKRGARRLKQFWLCLQRAMLQQWRTKAAVAFEMGLASVAGLLLGLAQNAKKGVLFTGIYNEPYDVLSVAIDIQSVPTLALLTVIAIGLVSAAPGVRVFSEEMLLYRREAEAGHSRAGYFLAKNLAVVPRMLAGCLHFTVLFLLIAVPIIDWGLAFLANLVYFYCIYGLASVVSMVVRREDAPLLATMISLIAGILSGAAPPLSKVQEWQVEWIWRASPATWLAELYFGQMVEPLRYLYNVDLAAELTGYHLRWLWRNMAVLLLIGTVYRVLAFVGLTAGKRLRV